MCAPRLPRSELNKCYKIQEPRCFAMMITCQSLAYGASEINEWFDWSGDPWSEPACPNRGDQSRDPAVYGLGSSQVCQEACQPSVCDRALWLIGRTACGQCVRLRFQLAYLD